jgi:microcompartment protein CcmL/EutN
VSGPDPLIARGAAVAVLEVASIARGVVALDQMAKRAETAIMAARTISPGRYLILLSGGVAEVEEAMTAGAEAAEGDKVDELILRDPARELLEGLAGRLPARLGESLLIAETSTVSASLSGAERALKDAEVHLLELRLGAGLSGKGVFSLTGALHMVEAAEESIRGAVAAANLVRIELIASPHPDLPSRLLGAEGAWVRGA